MKHYTARPKVTLGFFPRGLQWIGNCAKLLLHVIQIRVDDHGVSPCCNSILSNSQEYKFGTVHQTIDMSAVKQLSLFNFVN